MFFVLVCQKFDAVENIFNLNVKVESESQRGFTAVLLKLDLNLRQNSFSQQLEIREKSLALSKHLRFWNIDLDMSH